MRISNNKTENNLGFTQFWGVIDSVLPNLTGSFLAKFSKSSNNKYSSSK
jgi:hypothetical protein